MVEKYDIENSLLKNLKDKATLEFDYEIRNTKLEDKENLNSKMYYFHNEVKKYRIINYNNYWDSLDNPEPIVDVSKQKKRFQNEYFDLDMAYVTKRVIAIGFPARGCESIYRNSLVDIIKFFHVYHNNNVKVYNLCIEKERIYDKAVFNGINVGLFPSKDHNPCPLKLILDCCIDIILFLINNPEALVAIHCKAGKGRTGVMICCYLIFSGLCKSAEEAMDHYSVKRTYNKKGVTIPSQKRYIRYFESFLKANYSFPYIYMIPKIIKYHLKMDMTNILNNFVEDSSYFYQKNSFNINYFLIGPFNSEKNCSIEICDFFFKKIPIFSTSRNQKLGINLYNYKIELTERLNINTDLKVHVRGSIKFDLWFNLWYSSLELLKEFIDETFKGVKHHQLFLANFANPEIQQQIDIKDTRLINNNEPSNIDDYSSSNQKFLKIDQQSVTNRKNFIEDNKIEFNNDIPAISNEGIDDNEYVYIESMTNLFEIIEKVNRNESDLNLLIENINKICAKQGKDPFNKKDMTISIDANQLDNFSENPQKMKEGFAFKINFSLLETKK